MEYCEQDLASLLDNMTTPFSESEVKCLVLQVLEGLRYLHQRFIVHRDLKVSNLLLTDKGCIKIGLTISIVNWHLDVDAFLFWQLILDWLEISEFPPDQWHRMWWLCGIEHQSCFCHPTRILQPLICGHWAAFWGNCWGINRCFRERQRFNKSNWSSTFWVGLDSSLHNWYVALIKSLTLPGTPSANIWPEFATLPALKNFSLKQQPYNNIKSRFIWLSGAGLRLLNFLFMYDPKKRATAEECLQSTYFKEMPLRELIGFVMGATFLKFFLVHLQLVTRNWCQPSRSTEIYAAKPAPTNHPHNPGLEIQYRQVKWPFLICSSLWWRRSELTEFFVPKI